ncbi:hypothetical protein EDC01DRAFT_719243 [Geopyxis carbonaria]|nr:hypothetical protein EDC01DRAFT_719243 [Geopyxis carbonaria]
MPSAQPTELEELVGFLGSPQPQVRQLALEHCLGYSQGQKSKIFITPDLQPINHLKVAVNDIPSRSSHALTILINLCEHESVVTNLAEDETFMEVLMSKITNSSYPNADQIAMLLANISRNKNLGNLVRLERACPKDTSNSKFAMDQLMDCFVKGAKNTFNKAANFDYLSYLFANLSSLPIGRQYFISRQDYDGIIPISKLIVFTEDGSDIRRKGIASTIKNCCFDIISHPMLLNPAEVNILPYILLPLAGAESYSDEDMDGMPDDLQLLPPDKKRDSDPAIITTHLESLLLLTTTLFGRETLRRCKVYPIVRETHLAVVNDDVETACDRIVQVLMADEPPEHAVTTNDDDDEIVDIL